MFTLLKYKKQDETVIDIYYRNRVVTSSCQWMALLLDREKGYYHFNYHYSFSWENNCSSTKLENRLCFSLVLDFTVKLELAFTLSR